MLNIKGVSMINAEKVIKRALEVYIRLNLLQINYAMEDVVCLERNISKEKSDQLNKLINTFEKDACLIIHGHPDVHRGIFGFGIKDTMTNDAYQILKDLSKEHILVDKKIDYSGIK